MKKIVIAIIVALNILAWTAYFINERNSDIFYDTNINLAQKYIDKKIYVDAIKCLENAIVERPNIIESRMLLAKTYKEAGLDTMFEKYCIQLNKMYPENIDIAIMLGDFYCENELFQKAISWYFSLSESIQTDWNIVDKIEKLKYTYKIEYGNFDEIYEFCNGYGVYKIGEKYGIIDEYGDNIINAEYDNVGGISKINGMLLALVKKDNEYYFIDFDENRRMIPDYKSEYIGSFSEIGLAVIKVNGKYYYCDCNFTIKSDAFDYATNFVGNNAVVKIDGLWRIVDSNFKFISDGIEDVKIDYYNNAIRNNIIIAKKKGKYFPMNLEGRQIGSIFFDDLDFYLQDNIAAYENDGKWGFVDSAGNITIKEEYEGARSFSCGLASVKINEKWGFINADNKIVIEPKYNLALPFSSVGMAPVMDFKWEMLQLNSYLGDK